MIVKLDNLHGITCFHISFALQQGILLNATFQKEGGGSGHAPGHVMKRNMTDNSEDTHILYSAHYFPLRLRAAYITQLSSL